MTPSWNLFFIVFFIVGIAYGMMLQRERTVVTLVSIYVALVLTNLLTGPIGQFFTGERTINSFFVSSQVTPFTIQAAIFVTILVLMITKSGLSGGGDGRGLLSPVEVFLYSFLNTALIVTTIMSFMPEEARAAMISQSTMAAFLASHQTWWVILPVVCLIFFGWNRNPLLRA
ncbi:MAG: hypothetical protein AAB701_01570 [Patescibacteria group bacterium]